MATVTRISIAPVKALGLVFPDEVDLGPHGVTGDRRFWLQFGGLLNGNFMETTTRNGTKHPTPKLAQLSAVGD